MTTVTVLPSRDDPVVAAGAEGLGGPIGRRVEFGSNWWTPIRICMGVAMAVYALGFVSKGWCLYEGWGAPARYQYLCYSDMPFLFSSRGFEGGYLPYLELSPGGEHLEYPVLTGLFMLLATQLGTAFPEFASGSPAGSLNFYLANVILLGACLMVAVAATSLTVRHRPWDAMMFALAPSLLLASTINWDLLAIALTAVALALWSHRYPFWAGAFIGLGASAKLYPIFLLGPLFLLCLRAGRMQAFGKAFLGAAVTWACVNVPIMLANFEGWVHFYQFSQDRGMDFGSLWYALSLADVPMPAEWVNTFASGLFMFACIGIGALIMMLKHRPRLAQVAFLTIAAFAVSNKVYSPQFVLWLVPLAVLARPRWRDFLIWQACEVVYFIAIWWYLVGYGTSDKGLPGGWYVVATLVHIGGTIYLAAMVIRDMRHPWYDPVRADGFDDPAGGVLDRAEDAVYFGIASEPEFAHAGSRTAQAESSKSPKKVDAAKRGPKHR